MAQRGEKISTGYRMIDASKKHMKTLIIVLSSPHDLTAQQVMETLTKKGAQALLMDTGDFPSRLCLHAYLRNQSWQGEMMYDGQTYPLEQIRSILYRRPTHYRIESHLPKQVQGFAENEANKGFGGILRSLPCYWMSHPDAIRAAGYKPRQLQLACDLGLPIPETLITNSPQAVRDFFATHHGDIVMKSLHATNVGIDDTHFAGIYTKKITSDTLRHVDQVKVTAHLFQRYIDKVFEVRSIVVGDQVFSIRINSQHSAAARVDFRAGYSELTYDPYQLPAAIEQRCLEMTKQLGLRYGAIDLAVNTEGEHIFFEINSAGQFQWLEYFTGIPITEAIADELIRGGERA